MLNQEIVNYEVVETRSTTCPWPQVTPCARMLVELYEHYKNGFLLEAGGIIDQPAWYTEAMRFIDGKMNEIQAARNQEPIK